MIALLTVLYIGCFQIAVVPAVARVYRLKSSRDLSVWREWIVLMGVVIQFTVMYLTDASWFVLASPIASALSLLAVLHAIYRHR